MKHLKLFLEDIVEDNVIFESDEENSNYIYTIKSLDTSEFLVGYYYDVCVQSKGKYEFCLDGDKIGYADAKIDLKKTESIRDDVRNKYRGIRLYSDFFSNLYHAEIDEKVIGWYKFLENINTIINHESDEKAKELAENGLMCKIAYSVRERLHNILNDKKHAIETEYMYVSVINILLGMKNIDRKRASIIMHAIARDKFMVYNAECDRFLKLIDFDVTNESEKKLKWNIYYYLYSNMILSKLHHYHDQHPEYYNKKMIAKEKNKKEEIDIYLEASSYFIQNFRVDRFLYSNFK